MEDLIKIINTYITLSEQDIDIIKKLFVKKEFKKNENILLAGNTCKEFVFLQKGLIGVKSISEAAKKLGASEKEIAESLRIAYHIAGNRFLNSAVNAFD